MYGFMGGYYGAWAHMGAWVCGRVSAWVYECMDVWMYRELWFDRPLLQTLPVPDPDLTLTLTLILTL